MTALVLIPVTFAAFCTGWVLGGLCLNARRRKVVRVQVGALRGWRE